MSEESIVQIDDQEFETMFEEKNPKADNIKGTTPPEETNEDKDKKPEPAKEKTSADDTVIVSVDDEEDEDEEEEKKKPAKKEVKTAASEPEDEEDDVEDSDKQALIRAHIDHLIETGAWQPIEDLDSIELSDEVFAEMSRQQQEAKAWEIFSELVDSSGPYGKAIMKHSMNGGDPDKVIDLFKEQKAMEALNIEDEAGQKMAVEKYYIEVLNWKPEKVKKHIERLELDEELKEEAEHVKSKFDEHTNKQLEAINKKQEEDRRKAIEDQQAWEEGIREAIEAREDLEPARRKELERQLLVYDQQLKDGRKVSKFWVNFKKIESNPEHYLRLVEFVENPDLYVKGEAEKENTKKAKATFKFLQGNVTAKNKAKSQVSARRVSSDQGLNW